MRVSQLRFTSRRYRWISVACVATLGISAGLAGTLGVVRWQADRAVRGDTHVVLQQAAQQLTRALQSRRGTLTLLRDIFDRAPDLSAADRLAMAQSAVVHTRHLVGIGLTKKDKAFEWWTEPTLSSDHAQSQLDQAVTERMVLRTVWRSPSTFTAMASTDRPLLVMLEPLRASANSQSAILAVFDVKPLLADFFELTLQQPYPVQVTERGNVLYQARQWRDPRQSGQAVVEQSIVLDALQWVIRIEPGPTQAVRAIASFRGLLVVFGLLAGLSSIGMIWLLAMRTWLLQQTVSRRTAALRRTTERLRQLAITDELTGLYNRRFFHERWQWEYDRARRYRRPLGCLMIDVDGFKRINDVLGHQTGDLVLREIAQQLKTHLRQSDILARFGGDEFIVALPETTLDHTTAVAEKLRELSIHGTWSSAHGEGPVRLSVGVSQLVGDEPADEIIRQADADLYASRQATRGQPGSLHSEPTDLLHQPTAR